MQSPIAAGFRLVTKPTATPAQAAEAAETFVLLNDGTKLPLWWFRTVVDDVKANLPDPGRNSDRLTRRPPAGRRSPERPPETAPEVQRHVERLVAGTRYDPLVHTTGI